MKITLKGKTKNKNMRNNFNLNGISFRLTVKSQNENFKQILLVDRVILLNNRLFMDKTISNRFCGKPENLKTGTESEMKMPPHYFTFRVFSFSLKKIFFFFFNGSLVPCIFWCLSLS